MDAPHRPRAEKRGRPCTLPRDEEGKPIREAKEGRKKRFDAVRKEELCHRVALLYSELLADGMTHEGAMAQMLDTPMEYESGELSEEVADDGEIRQYTVLKEEYLTEDTVKKYLAESRKKCVTGDEFRAAPKSLQKNPRLKEMFDYLDSLKK